MIKYTGQVTFKNDVRLQWIKKVVNVLESFDGSEVSEEEIVSESHVSFTLRALSGWQMRGMIYQAEREFGGIGGIEFRADEGELFLVRSPGVSVKLDILTGDYPNPEQEDTITEGPIL
jgi:hypothetical protein